MIPLYQRVLGDTFHALCPAVKALHAVTADCRATGRCDVTRGGNWLANRLADLVGMPPSGLNVPLGFSIAFDGERERWTRDFAGHQFQSLLWNKGEALFERLGPVLFEFRLVVRDGALRMVLRKGWLLGLLRLPRFCLPAVSTQEFCADGLYQFDVQVDWPLLGRVIRYRGTLAGVSAGARFG